MSSKVKNVFMSPASLKACFYLWVILLLLTPVAYIYDYKGFELTDLREFSFAIAVFYTFALGTYLEIQRTKQPNRYNFPWPLILLSNFVSVILLVLFSWSVIDYNAGYLGLDQVYDPIIQLFFLYLLFKSIKDMRHGLGSKETSLIS